MKTTFQTIIRDRSYATPFIIGGLIVFALLVLGVFNIRPAELQIPVRYTSYGITNFYNEPWFYQLAFMAFSMSIFVMHTMVCLKLYQKKGQTYAVAFQWLTVAILVIAFVTIATIFRVADIV